MPWNCAWLNEIYVHDPHLQSRGRVYTRNSTLRRFREHTVGLCRCTSVSYGWLSVFAFFFFFLLRLLFYFFPFRFSICSVLEIMMILYLTLRLWNSCAIQSKKAFQLFGGGFFFFFFKWNGILVVMLEKNCCGISWNFEGLRSRDLNHFCWNDWNDEMQ